MKKNAVIFDLDGTMWNACEPVLISWNRVLGAPRRTARGDDGDD